MSRIFASIAQARADEVAVADEFGATSWRDFDERVNRLVHVLRGAGLESGDCFAIVSGNRREYFEAMAAAAHAGLRFVPVNWHWVAEELAYVLADSGAKALLADSRFAELAAAGASRAEAPALALKAVWGAGLGDGTGRPVDFEDYEALLAASSGGEPEDQRVGGPMFYTSGTTGRPKGVVTSMFRGGQSVDLLLAIGRAVQGSLGIPERGTSLLVGPVYHSAQWAFSFLPMLSGTAVVMRHRFDAAETLELIDRYRITNLHLVPTQLVRLLRLDEAQRRAFDGGSLVVCWHGAAPCPPAVKREMIEWWGPRISEYYGATEGAILSTIDAQSWLERPDSVGRPLPHVEVRVVREDGSLAVVGEEGQLYFKSRLGSDFEYHRDPEKTAAAHLEPGVFTVGDVGYLDEEGFLHLSDRKIDMIISGGVNIYPAEIEGVLASHPAVFDAAVFGIPDEEYGEQVKAAVQLAPGWGPDPETEAALIRHCREHLAGYKAPRSIDFEASLPRHPTGKLYKRLLRDRYWPSAGRRI